MRGFIEWILSAKFYDLDAILEAASTDKNVTNDQYEHLTAIAAARGMYLLLEG